MDKVIGQTGKVVLSDEAINYKLSQKRTVRYRYVKCANLWRAEVIGPFHSALYGACSYGTTRTRAKASLKASLADNHNYIGFMIFSDFDEADNVGNVVERLLDANAMARPITNNELIGSAGQ